MKAELSTTRVTVHLDARNFRSDSPKQIPVDSCSKENSELWLCPLSPHLHLWLRPPSETSPGSRKEGWEDFFALILSSKLNPSCCGYQISLILFHNLQLTKPTNSQSTVAWMSIFPSVPGGPPLLQYLCLSSGPCLWRGCPERTIFASLAHHTSPHRTGHFFMHLLSPLHVLYLKRFQEKICLFL